MDDLIRLSSFCLPLLSAVSLVGINPCPGFIWVPHLQSAWLSLGQDWTPMAAAAASTTSPAAPRQSPSVDSTVHQLEVACAELKSLHESRAVYERRGAVFFRTTVKAAAKSQLQELEKVKARAKNVSS